MSNKKAHLAVFETCVFRVYHLNYKNSYLPTSRGKKILEQLSTPRFFPGFEISRSFHRAKQVGEKGGKFQNPEKIVVFKVVLIFLTACNVVERS